MNSQSYYFKFVRDRETLIWLSRLRPGGTDPIGRAPMAVAICSDPSQSRGHVQDGCIGAYHLMLAAWHYGLGTCWIGSMDRKDAKRRLGIPEEHYVATITPLGFPAGGQLLTPHRHEASHFVRE
jgi:nitroreductase